jgi:radical SAM superfamily enzyme
MIKALDSEGAPLTQARWRRWWDGLKSEFLSVTHLEDNLRFLREQTGVHVHADLIVGLPGEDLESFGRGFDRLVAIGLQEIQVGILKRLRGTPIVRHDSEFEMK